MLLMLRADLELGRGRFDAARAHLDAALSDASRGPRAGDLRRRPRGAGPVGAAMDGRRPGGADGLARASSPRAAQLRVWFCAKGLRAHAELAALARARRDATPSRWLARSRREAASPSLDVAAAEASAITPNAAGWLRPGRGRVRARYAAAPGPSCGRRRQPTWERLERPPLAAYCRWREAEALVAAGATRTEAERAAPARRTRSRLASEQSR